MNSALFVSGRELEGEAREVGLKDCRGLDLQGM